MAIGTLSARIMADAAGIKSGLGLTRNELKLTRQAFLDSRTDAEKLNESLKVLESAKAKGAFTNEADYARAIAQVRAEFDPAARAAAQFAARQADLRAGLKGVATEAAGTVPGMRSLVGVFSGGHPALIAATAGLAAFTAGMAVAISLGRSFVSTVRGQFDEVDKLSKLSRNIGWDPEQLVVLDLAARRAGVETDRLGQSLGRMAKAIGEAEMGRGGAGKALEQIGLSVRDLAAMRPDQQFAAISEAIRKLPTPTQQAAAAAAIFGSDVKDLMGVLALGKDAIAAYQAEAETAGLIFTAEQGAAVERFNDAVDSIKDVITGLGRQAAVELAPAMADVAESMREAFNDPTVQSGLEDAATSLGILARTAPIAAQGLGFAANEAGRFALNLAQMQLPSWLQALAQGGRAVAGSVWGGLVDETQAANDRTKELDAQLAETRRKLGIDGGVVPLIDAEGTEDAAGAAVSAIDQTIAKLTEQAETYGMSADQIAIYQAAKAGALPDELNEIRNLQEQIRLRKQEADEFQRAAAAEADKGEFEVTKKLQDQLKEGKKNLELLKEEVKEAERISKLIDTTIDKYEEQAATAGMSAEQAERWKLAHEGVQPEIVEQIIGLKKAADEAVRAAEAEKNLGKGVNAALAGSAEAAEAIQRFRAQAGRQEVEITAPIEPGPLPITIAGSPPPELQPIPADNREAVWQAMLTALNRIADNTGQPGLELDVEEVAFA